MIEFQRKPVAKLKIMKVNYGSLMVSVKSNTSGLAPFRKYSYKLCNMKTKIDHPPFNSKDIKHSFAWNTKVLL